MMEQMVAADPDVTLLAALADPTRLSIVRQLAGRGGPVCACDFAECCTVSQPTISHHLRVLRLAGVVSTERRGTNIYYSLGDTFAGRWTSVGLSLAGLVQVGDRSVGPGDRPAP